MKPTLLTVSSVWTIVAEGKDKNMFFMTNNKLYEMGCKTRQQR